ncbi:MAG: UvrD-helicase domain-containing protein [Nitrosomonas sp.]|nr:MAG: UvrD-helicase domain-containing protein [Nitrosomonas sp.]
MSDVCVVSDAAERLRALDPAQSIIVQAPAGSGKTALLIQRYLKLLAQVDAPEEIIAITFTRKAAAEMRTRVLAALAADAYTAESGNAYDELNRSLAQAVFQRDRQAGWQLAENPERLRIQTIDSFCAALARQMPLLSGFGAQPEVIDDASDYYREAARATMALLERDCEIGDDVERLLEHLDNDGARVEGLLAEMLARRDHWLRHVHGRTRDELEVSLQHSRQHVLDKALQLFPEAFAEELLLLLRYAAGNLIVAGSSSDIVCCAPLTALSVADFSHWRGIAELLLTKSGEWRKQINVAVGFPAGNSKTEKQQATHWKKRLEVVIAALSRQGALNQVLQEMRQLPASGYSDRQWEILGAITRLLPNAVAQLKIIFQANGSVDFTEVAQAALLALGDTDAPTDLALALDYRIKHLMIDEFQDTSISQFKLIEKLVAGWEAGDGRTLFIVGDPMQSIYRFREAEVGLFLQARSRGVGELKLQPVALRTNFRSQRGMVEWVNAAFAQIMSYRDDSVTGAVTYSASDAIHPGQPGEAVTIHPSFVADHGDKACRVIEIIQRERQERQHETIAILVRNRSHLNEIVARIKSAGLRFRAVDIEHLQHRPVVQDLLMLTRALINPADRLAWFSLLRAPWCGLLLDDMTVLAAAETQQSRTVWEIIDDDSCGQDLTQDARIRLQRLRDVLAPCMENRRRRPLRVIVEAVWLALGGVNARDGNVKDALMFLDYLENREAACEIRDWASFERGLNVLYASPDLEADDSLQIMTIHKAKGLEFDTVIIPGLGRASRNPERRLLKWMEQPYSHQISGEKALLVADLLLAPISETGAATDPIYAWLEKLDRDKEQFEADRLLYVAATRAKRKLHLLGATGMAIGGDQDHQPKEPAAGSLLRRLWPVVQLDYIDAAAKYVKSEVGSIESENVTINHRIFRLGSDWVFPAPAPALSWGGVVSESRRLNEIEFSWASEMARFVGVVVHRWLQQVAENELKGWSLERIAAMAGQFEQNLLAVGMIDDSGEMNYAVQRVIRALSNAITDQRGRWILGPQQHARNELRLAGIKKNRVTDWVVDRTFYDADGIRWIIDYKTSDHEGADRKEFLDREQFRYQHQLNQYADLLNELDSRSIKLGLYFPLMSGWREWDYIRA